METIEKVVANLVQRVEKRFYGKYRGLVVDNADPLQLGRLKVKVPSVLGNEVVTGWAMPCVPYGGNVGQGILFVPEVNAGVWVEFEEGDLEFPVWVGTFWSKPGGESELTKPNDADGKEQDSVQDPPTRKIIKTKKGHTIQFEDADGEEMVIIREAVNGHMITLDSRGITIEDGAGEIRIKDASGNEVVMDNSGINCRDNSGNKISMDSWGMEYSDCNDNSIVMDAMSGYPGGPGVKVNSGDNRVCLEGLIQWLLEHQHVGNMGAPTPLFPGNMAKLLAAQLGGNKEILSSKIKVE